MAFALLPLLFGAGVLTHEMHKRGRVNQLRQQNLAGGLDIAGQMGIDHELISPALRNTLSLQEPDEQLSTLKALRGVLAETRPQLAARIVNKPGANTKLVATGQYDQDGNPVYRQSPALGTPEHQELTDDVRARWGAFNVIDRLRRSIEQGGRGIMPRDPETGRQQALSASVLLDMAAQISGPMDEQTERIVRSYLGESGIEGLLFQSDAQVLAGLDVLAGRAENAARNAIDRAYTIDGSAALRPAYDDMRQTMQMFRQQRQEGLARVIQAGGNVQPPEVMQRAIRQGAIRELTQIPGLVGQVASGVELAGQAGVIPFSLSGMAAGEGLDVDPQGFLDSLVPDINFNLPGLPVEN